MGRRVTNRKLGQPMVMACGVYVRGRKVTSLSESEFVAEARRVAVNPWDAEMEEAVRLTFRKLVASGQLEEVTN